MTLDSFIHNVRSLNSKDLIVKAAKLTTDQLADLNVEQMDQGLLSTGNKIQPDYSPSYEKYKGFKTPNLKDEGDFHDETYAKVIGSEIEFGSTDWKSNKLQIHYTKNIFGVTEKNFIETIDPELPEIIDNEITK